MHLFGTLGILSFIGGFGILLYLSILKIGFNELRIATRPLFHFGILMLVIGSQLFLTGFLAELIARSSPHRNNYQVEKRV